MTPTLSHVGDIPADISTDKLPASDPRVQKYVKAFQRSLRRRPTDLQRRLMWQAALAQIRYSDALNNPHIRPNDLEALERVARRAANAMHASFQIGRALLGGRV